MKYIEVSVPHLALYGVLNINNMFARSYFLITLESSLKAVYFLKKKIQITKNADSYYKNPVEYFPIFVLKAIFG